MGWGRRELAQWLVCHYGPCVIPNDERDPSERGASGPLTISESSVVELVCDARAAVLRILWELGDREKAEILARSMIATGAVMGLRDSRGGIAHVPANIPRMRLVERVASLFVADYLNAPFDYRDLRVCADCGAIAWSAPLKHVGGCRTQTSVRRDSHVSRREVRSVVESGVQLEAGMHDDVRCA